ncbi:MAG TPA: hypothetical protein PKI11_18380 [Candidatus Hydrogenedentes bacterium]|nr:hypothetical protein [Candidatus Hydrogenedentota bacterium]
MRVAIGGRLGSDHDDHVMRGDELRGMGAKVFADAPLYPITHHGAAHSARHCDA